jgi:RNA polymerase sigma-70 factor (ECF subfamily)
MVASLGTHATLLAKLRNCKDQNAWREFNERYGELLRSFARRQGLQPADCDDVAQDVLLGLSRAMGGFQYDPARGKFRSYLKTAALRAIFARPQRKAGQMSVEELDERTHVAQRDDAIEQMWEDEWRAHHIRTAMRIVETEFNAKDCRAFCEYGLERHDPQEVAAHLQSSLDQVYKAKSMILKRMKELVDQQVQDEG